MKLVQCERAGQQLLGLLTEDGSAVRLLIGRDAPRTTLDLLSAGSGDRSRADVLAQLRTAADSCSETARLDQVTLLAPVTRPDKVLCICMNYADLCAELNRPVPTEPVVFNKFPSCIIGPQQDIVYPAVTSELDWEVELAIVVGRRCQRVSEAQAPDYIFGYTVAYDVSARDWHLRRNGGQWLLGKAMDTFCPLGPCITTADSLDPHRLRLSCHVNGQQTQSGSTDQLVFNCHQLVSHVSQCVTLLPGDLILTGTPPGGGVFRKPPQFLRRGDLVKCSIDGIGTIANRVV